MKKALIAFVSQCNRKANDILKKPVASFTEEDFHVLRTSIKKLKAITSVFKAGTKKNKRKKITNAYKKIFRSAGIIRELQLELKTLRRLKISPKLKSYLNLLTENIEKEKQRFEKIKGESLMQELKEAERKTVKMIRTGKKKDWKISLEKLKKRIDQLLREKFDPGNLHLLRKQLKIYKYTAKFGGKVVPAKLDKIIDSLGEWHDCDVLNNHLKQAVRKKIILRDDIAVIQSEKRLLKRTEQLEKEIHDFRPG